MTSDQASVSWLFVVAPAMPPTGGAEPRIDYLLTLRRGLVGSQRIGRTNVPFGRSNEVVVLSALRNPTGTFKLVQGKQEGMFDSTTTLDFDWRAPITCLSLSRVSDEAIRIALTCSNSYGTRHARIGRSQLTTRELDQRCSRGLSSYTEALDKRQDVFGYESRLGATPSENSSQLAN